MSLDTTKYAALMGIGELNYPLHAALATEVFGLPVTELDAFSLYCLGMRDKRTTTRVEFTPDIAKKILADRNAKNRATSRGLYKQYARTMSEGKWKDYVSIIVFDENGILRDGQHRLAAVAESGTTQRFLVSTYLDEKAIQAIDLGRKRSVADILALTGVSKGRASHIGKAVELVHFVNYEVFARNAYVSQSIGPTLKITFAEKYSSELNTVADIFAPVQGKTPVPVQALTALVMLVDDSHRDKAIEFGTNICGLTFGNDKTDANNVVTGFDPLRQLHMRCDEARSRSTGRKKYGAGCGSIDEKERTMGFVFAAWNAWIEGKQFSTKNWHGTHFYASKYPKGTKKTDFYVRSTDNSQPHRESFDHDVFRPKYYTNRSN